MSIKKAISEFSEKLKSYNNASEEGRIYKKPKESAESRLETLMAEKDFAFCKTVISTYRKYRFPLKALGEKSTEAAEIAADQKSLEACYKLYKALQEANAKDGLSGGSAAGIVHSTSAGSSGRTATSTAGTYLKAELVTPLTSKDKYTLGDDFIYLICYLHFELKCADLVPYFERKADGTFSLKFTNAENAKFSALQKDVMTVVKTTFYTAGN